MVWVSKSQSKSRPCKKNAESKPVVHVEYPDDGRHASLSENENA
jgi:hypothetical protein